MKTLELTNRNSTLKLDRHPFEGVARITIIADEIYNDGDEDEYWSEVSAVFILTNDDCIKLRDELNMRINQNNTTK